MTEPTLTRHPSQSGFDPWGFVRRRGVMIIVGTVAAALAALIFSLGVTETFTAQAQLVLDGQSIDERVFPRQAIAVEDAASPDTPLALASLSQLRDQTQTELGSVQPSSTLIFRQGASNVINVTVTDTDPELAASFATALAENVIPFLRDQDRQALTDAKEEVQRELATLPAGRRGGPEGLALRRQATRITVIRALQTGGARLVEPAAVPGAPITSTVANAARNVVLAAILGLVASMGLALLADRTDPRLKDLAELQSAFGFVLLGRVPKLDREPGLRLPPGDLPAAEAEAYQLLRSRLQYFNVDRNVTSLLITSASAGDGKTTVARYLAAAAAQVGARALLVEADLRSPVLAAQLGLAGAPGLAEALSGQASFEDVVQTASESEPNLDVIVAGSSPPNPAALLESDRAGELFQDLSTSYDLMVVDTAPITVVADAFPLVRLVDGAIVVGRVNHTRADGAVLLREQLLGLGAHVLGVVATGVGSQDPYPSQAKEPGALDRVLSS